MICSLKNFLISVFEQSPMVIIFIICHKLMSYICHKEKRKRTDLAVLHDVELS